MENTKCPVAKKCSGCQLSNLSYEQQLAWKQKDVAGLLGSYVIRSFVVGAAHGAALRIPLQGAGGIPQRPQRQDNFRRVSVVQKRYRRY